MTVASEACHRALTMLAGRIIEEVDLRGETPRHPYAALLFAPWDRPLPGAPLAPDGCPFVTTCPLAGERLRPTCAARVPDLLPLAAVPAHRVACHAVHEEES
jgi:ABC-type dipeptide/oligopeptide/nickel transport system ATPase component